MQWKGVQAAAAGHRFLELKEIGGGLMSVNK